MLLFCRIIKQNVLQSLAQQATFPDSMIINCFFRVQEIKQTVQNLFGRALCYIWPCEAIGSSLIIKSYFRVLEIKHAILDLFRRTLCRIWRREAVGSSLIIKFYLRVQEIKQAVPNSFGRAFLTCMLIFSNISLSWKFS